MNDTAKKQSQIIQSPATSFTVMRDWSRLTGQPAPGPKLSSASIARTYCDFVSKAFKSP